MYIGYQKTTNRVGRDLRSEHAVHRFFYSRSHVRGKGRFSRIGCKEFGSGPAHPFGSFGKSLDRKRKGVTLLEAYTKSYTGKNYRKEYTGREDLELFSSLFKNPNEWWDYRDPALKKSSTSPDFRHRWEYRKVLWLYKKFSAQVYKDIPLLKERTEKMNAAQLPWQKPLVPPTPSEAWQDLFENPGKYVNRRETKTSEAQPDFVNVRTGFAMWLNNCPYGKEGRLDGMVDKFAQDFPAVKPKMTDSLGLPIRETEAPEGKLTDDEEESVIILENEEEEEDEQSWEEATGSKMVEDLLGTFDPSLADEATPPQEVMGEDLQLMRYQRQGLAWMMRREESSNPRGGLLCDQQGLGKTVQALALIVSNPCPVETPPSNGVRPEDTDAPEPSHQEDETDIPSNAFVAEAGLPIKGTLVVAPKSVLPNWKREIEKGTNLKVLLYAGTEREKHQDPQSLAEYDVVLASYNIILYDSSLVKRSDVRATFKVQWWRIVLDEVQNIRNWANDTTAAIALLSVREGGRKWGLSGTPIQNSEKELFSYLNFLDYAPWNKRQTFDDVLQKSCDRMEVFRQLQNIMQPIMLRRTKQSTIDGERILNLPERLVTRHEVKMKGDELKAYETMRDFALREYEVAEEDSSFSILLTILLNLRRGTGHAWMAQQFWDRVAPLDLGEILEKRAAGAKRKGGAVEYISEMPEELRRVRENLKPSAKMRELLKLLKQYPGDKFIVFSQWTDMLDLLEDMLNDKGVGYARLDGKMEQQKREDAIAQMRDDSTKRVFLVSLLAGKEGLNLQFCNRIVLMDPHFNPMVEEQAIDRAHRFGQEKPVHAHKFYVRDSVDEAIFAIQDYKLAISASIISDSSEEKVLGRDRLKQIFSHLKEEEGPWSEVLKPS